MDPEQSKGKWQGIHPQAGPTACPGMGLGSSCCPWPLNADPHPMGPTEPSGTHRVGRILAASCYFLTHFLCILNSKALPTFSLSPSRELSLLCVLEDMVLMPSLTEVPQGLFAYTCRLISCVTQMSLTY